MIYADFEEFRVVTYPKVKPNLYEISNFGTLRNIKTGKVLAIENNKGYLFCRIRATENHCSQYIHTGIHRLVCWEFVKKPDNIDELDINHKDGDPLNNYYVNLEWVSRQFNIFHRDAYGNTAFGERHGFSSHKEDVVIEVCKLIKEGCDAPMIAKHILEKFPDRYEGVKDYNRIRNLVSKINRKVSWEYLYNRIVLCLG